MIAAGLVVVAIIGLNIFAAIQPVVSHIEMRVRAVHSRVQVVFWSATLVAVILLGLTWTLAERVAAGGARVEEDVLLAETGAGLAAASLVAARIVMVVGRVRRRGRQDGGG